MAAAMVERGWPMISSYSSVAAHRPSGRKARPARSINVRNFVFTIRLLCYHEPAPLPN